MEESNVSPCRRRPAAPAPWVAEESRDASTCHPEVHVVELRRRFEEASQRVTVLRLMMAARRLRPGSEGRSAGGNTPWTVSTPTPATSPHPPFSLPPSPPPLPSAVGTDHTAETAPATAHHPSRGVKEEAEGPQNQSKKGSDGEAPACSGGTPPGTDLGMSFEGASSSGARSASPWKGKPERPQGKLRIHAGGPSPPPPTADVDTSLFSPAPCPSEDASTFAGSKSQPDSKWRGKPERLRGASDELHVAGATPPTTHAPPAEDTPPAEEPGPSPLTLAPHTDGDSPTSDDASSGGGSPRQWRGKPKRPREAQLKLHVHAGVPPPAHPHTPPAAKLDPGLLTPAPHPSSVRDDGHSPSADDASSDARSGSKKPECPRELPAPFACSTSGEASSLGWSGAKWKGKPERGRSAALGKVLTGPSPSPVETSTCEAHSPPLSPIVHPRPLPADEGRPVAGSEAQTVAQNCSFQSPPPLLCAETSAFTPPPPPAPLVSTESSTFTPATALFLDPGLECPTHLRLHGLGAVVCRDEDRSWVLSTGVPARAAWAQEGSACAAGAWIEADARMRRVEKLWEQLALPE
eukprot:Hpha_TRINITY_DN11595_c1_g1::TRINITY_DN11595_c1_g1_i1::g.32424::m.32424